MSLCLSRVFCSLFAGGRGWCSCSCHTCCTATIIFGELQVAAVCSTNRDAWPMSSVLRTYPDLTWKRSSVCMRDFKAQQLREVGGQSGEGARWEWSWRTVRVLSFPRTHKRRIVPLRTTSSLPADAPQLNYWVDFSEPEQRWRYSLVLWLSLQNSCFIPNWHTAWR